MQCGILNWILNWNRKKAISGKTSDIQLKSGVQLTVYTNVLSFDKCTMVFKDVTLEETWNRIYWNSVLPLHFCQI